MQVIPNRSASGSIFHIGEMIVNDSLQVPVDTKQRNGTELGKHHVKHDVIVVSCYRMMIESIIRFFRIFFQGDHQYGSVENHVCPLPFVGQQVIVAESLTQIGGLRNAAFRSVGLIDNLILRLVVSYGKRHTLLADTECQPRAFGNDAVLIHGCKDN